MEDLKLIQEGAEAQIFQKNTDGNLSIVKERNIKKYRLPVINVLLIPSRTKRELKVMKKLNDLSVRVPNIIFSNKKNIIEMEFIQGNKLRDVLDNNVELTKKLGQILAIIHDNGIIHGDLTTSNMILEDNGDICLIDFGLSIFSDRFEDKAVDIHLFKQALESKHHKIFDIAYENFLEGYKLSKNYSETINRLNLVESRGRNKK